MLAGADAPENADGGEAAEADLGDETGAPQFKIGQDDSDSPVILPLNINFTDYTDIFASFEYAEPDGEQLAKRIESNDPSLDAAIRSASSVDSGFLTLKLREVHYHLVPKLVNREFTLTIYEADDVLARDTVRVVFESVNNQAPVFETPTTQLTSDITMPSQYAMYVPPGAINGTVLGTVRFNDVAPEDDQFSIETATNSPIAATMAVTSEIDPTTGAFLQHNGTITVTIGDAAQVHASLQANGEFSQALTVRDRFGLSTDVIITMKTLDLTDSEQTILAKVSDQLNDWQTRYLADILTVFSRSKSALDFIDQQTDGKWDHKMMVNTVIPINILAFFGGLGKSSNNIKIKAVTTVASLSSLISQSNDYLNDMKDEVDREVDRFSDDVQEKKDRLDQEKYDLLNELEASNASRNERLARLHTFFDYVVRVTPEEKGVDLPSQNDITGAMIVELFDRADWDIDGSEGKTRIVQTQSPQFLGPMSQTFARPYWTTDEIAFYTEESPSLLDASSNDPGDLIDFLNAITYRIED